MKSSAPERSWEARPVAARVIRVAVLLVPISVGCLAAIGANRLIAPPDSVVPALLRAAAIVVISSAVVWGADRFARRLLPLAALMQLSLVFPDQAPSRFRSALRSGSSRTLERTLDDTRRHGLAKDPGDAARQVVQLIGAIGDHDRRTRGHSERVRLFADLVGEELKLSKEERQKLQWGALLHDLGKLMVPSDILNKKGKPSAEEWRILEGHPDAGMELIAPLREFLGEWVHAIGGHHEKWDGSGYPAGLRGGQIPRAAAIVAVADSFEVMTAVRSYKKAMPLAEARAELTRCAGTHFSPEVVRAFLSISLGHLRIVAGPLAALAHLPFLGNLAQLPGAAAAAAPAMVSAAAVPAAAMVTAAALTLGTPPKADAVENLTLTQEATAVAAAAAEAPAAKGADGDSTTTSAAAANPAIAAAAAGDTATPASTPTTSPTATTAATAAVAPPTTAAAPAGAVSSTTVAAPSTDAARRPASTTTLPPTTTTSAPPAAAPATSAPTSPYGTFTLLVSTAAIRLPPQSLNGASFARGTNLYVYAPTSAERVEFEFPGGTHRAENYPFDMVTSTGIYASPWIAPATPGTYTITAKTHGSGASKTATATFTIT